mgnify:CR=1 FL=1
MTRLGYLWAQLRHTVGKRHKRPLFRILPAITVLRDVGGLPRGATVLDIGVRNRVEPDLLEDEGWIVTAVDLWPMARRIRRADMHALPFPDASYDAVVCSHVLEHAFSPELALKEVTRVLRPGGLLWAAFPTHFRLSKHDRVNYGSAAAFVARLPRAASALWEENQPMESRVLVRMA